MARALETFRYPRTCWPKRPRRFFALSDVEGIVESSIQLVRLARGHDAFLHGRTDQVHTRTSGDYVAIGVPRYVRFMPAVRRLQPIVSKRCLKLPAVSHSCLAPRSKFVGGHRFATCFPHVNGVTSHCSVLLSDCFERFRESLAPIKRCSR